MESGDSQNLQTRFMKKAKFASWDFLIPKQPPPFFDLVTTSQLMACHFLMLTV